MELRQLEYFLAIADCENMTTASKTLHVSQPSLSASLKALEQELDTKLFDRFGKRIALNENGRYFAQRARSALSIIGEARTVMVSRDREREKTVNCSLGIPIGNGGKLLLLFYEKHPNITLRVGYPTSVLFKEQTVDLHLFGTSLDIDDPNVVKLGYERYMLALPRDHRLAGRSSVKLGELRDDPFVFTEPSEIYHDTKGMCRTAGFEPHVVYESQVFFEALNAVEAGVGCALAAEFTWLWGVSNDIAVVPIDGETHGRYLYARLPENVKPSQATWEFLDFLQDYANWISPAKGGGDPADAEGAGSRRR